MTITKEHFKQQIEKSEPCSGVFGMSLEELQKSCPMLSVEKLKDVLDKKTKEYAEHKGDKMLFVLIENLKKNAVSVIKIWESEIDNLNNEYVLVNGPTETTDMPRLRLREPVAQE